MAIDLTHPELEDIGHYDWDDYKDVLRDFYAGLAMMALIPMIDSAEGGQRMPEAAFDIATEMIKERNKR